MFVKKAKDVIFLSSDSYKMEAQTYSNAFIQKVLVGYLHSTITSFLFFSTVMLQLV